jgi:hypothetical protein
MDTNYLDIICEKCKGILCNNCVVKMYKIGLEMGLSEYDRFPYNNPQLLNMNQLKERVYSFDRYLSCKHDRFIGGALSGD